MSKEIKVSDLFKEYGDRSKPTPDVDKWYNNRSVYSKNFVKSHYRNTANDFSKLVSDEDIKEIKLVGDYSITDFPIQANNRVQFFYTPDGKKVDYKEITKVEKIEPSEYEGNATNQLKKIGFTDFYQLYKYDYELRREVELCIMAIYRG